MIIVTIMVIQLSKNLIIYSGMSAVNEDSDELLIPHTFTYLKYHDTCTI